MSNPSPGQDDKHHFYERPAFVSTGSPLLKLIKQRIAFRPDRRHSFEIALRQNRKSLWEFIQQMNRICSDPAALRQNRKSLWEFIQQMNGISSDPADPVDPRETVSASVAQTDPTPCAGAQDNCRQAKSLKPSLNSLQACTPKKLKIRHSKFVDS